MKKTVIFQIFADIKRHNFKYFGQFLINLVTIILGLGASECRQFYSKILYPLGSEIIHFTSSQKNLSTEKNYLTIFDYSGLDAIKKLHFRLWRKKVLIL